MSAILSTSSLPSCPSLCVPVYLPVCLSQQHLSLFTCLRRHLSVCLPLCMPECLPFSALAICLPVYLCASLSAGLPVCLPILTAPVSFCSCAKQRLSLSSCLCASVSAILSTNSLPSCPFLCVPVHLPVCLSKQCLSLFACLRRHLSFCLPVCVPACLCQTFYLPVSVPVFFA